MIESQVVGVDKMIYMKSISGNDGSYSLLALVRVRHRSGYQHRQRQQSCADRTRKDTRGGQAVGRHRQKKSSALLAVIAVYSPKQTYDELFLSNYVTINLLDQIKSTPGVGDAQLFGPQDYSMRVWIKTDQLTGLGLTTGDVISAIQSQNVQAAVGRIGARPVSDDQQLQLNIQTKGRLSSTEEFEKIIIRSNPDGSVLRLGDIARLELGAANLDRATRLNGAPATLIGIYQSPGANALKSIDALNKLMTDNAKSFPEGVAWKVTYDPTVFVRATIEKVKHTLVEAALLVLLVVFIFLGNIRATLIPMIAVPVSLIGTFVVLNAIGYSANTVSLLAMILAIGIVVDDAIVVVEAVEQTMEAHPELSPGEATKLAMQGIFAPIIAITLVLLAVFVPVAFISGISGELFRQFAVTVAVSMFLSAINALTLSPALCAVLLKPHHGPKRGLMGMLSRRSTRPRRLWSGRCAAGPAFHRRHHRGGGGTCRHWAACQGDTDRLLPVRRSGRVLRRGPVARRRLDRRTSDVVRQAEDILKKESAIADVSAIIGLNFVDNYSQPNSGFLVVTLKNFDERKGDSETSDAIIARLAGALRRVQGGNAVPLAPPPIIGLGTGGGFQLRAAGSAGRRTRRHGAGAARAGDRCQPGSAAGAGIHDLFRDQSFGVPGHRPRQGAHPRDRNQLDIPGAADLARRLLCQRHQSVRTHLAGPGAGGSEDRSSVDDIYRINVRSADGNMVPLRSLVEVRSCSVRRV